jgi:single-strand DNA-binding protein
MLNSVVLVGRCGQDPEIKYFETGKAKTTFSLAVNRTMKKPDGTTDTDWFRIELWGKPAEIAAQYVKKGALIGISGSVQINRWTDNNGQKQEMPIIAAQDLRLLGSKNDNQSASFSKQEFSSF